MWEKSISINDVSEIRGKSTVYLGCGAIEKIFDISSELKAQGIDKVLIVTGRSSYKSTGAWDYVEKALKVNDIEFVLYDKVTANPTTTHVDEASEMGRKLGAKAVIGIGGGSPIDAAKSAAIMTLNPDHNTADLYEYRFTPEASLPVIAINTTHGTGTEGNRFAVVSVLEKEYKPAIAYEFSYPLYSIDDPKLMVSLPPHQTTYTAVDAVNHVIEACTTKGDNPYVILLAKETVRLVAEYLPKALKDGNDLEARYYLTYASLIAGICFDNGFLHLTHALEHPLSAVKPDLAHGLGLAMLLPAIVKNVYPACYGILGDVLSPMVPELKGDASEAEAAAAGVKKWLESVGVEETLTTTGFSEDSVDRLVQLAFETPSLSLLLDSSPVEATRELVGAIYKDSM